MDYAWPFILPICAILGAFAYAIVRSVSYARVRELEVRERIAMIERGLVPPPEKDPNGFERAMNRYDRVRDLHHDQDWDHLGRRRSPGRYRSAGITLIGVGFGLMLLIGVAGGNPSSGVGVGGFVVILGAAFFLNSLFGSSDEPRMPPSQEKSSSPAEPPPTNR
ncbi:MAG TPA: hypothetical protein VMS04_19170 [Vicinamibacterales bacterium]|nr:hypothetical protein [Vicinamibacterales bacterium]